MDFEWDAFKAAVNLAKHGVSFPYAARVFQDPLRLDWQDMRQDYGEAWRLAIGHIEQRVFVVAYTERDGTIRIISARKANEREKRRYHALHTGPTPSADDD